MKKTIIVNRDGFKSLLPINKIIMIDFYDEENTLEYHLMNDILIRESFEEKEDYRAKYEYVYRCLCEKETSPNCY